MIAAAINTARAAGAGEQIDPLTQRAQMFTEYRLEWAGVSRATGSSAPQRREQRLGRRLRRRGILAGDQ